MSIQARTEASCPCDLRPNRGMSGRGIFLFLRVGVQLENLIGLRRGAS
jgi:hypothetical protein